MPDLLGALEAILAACGDDGVLAALAAAARDAGFAGAMLVETDAADRCPETARARGCALICRRCWPR